MSTQTHDHAGHNHAEPAHDDQHGPAKGLTRWLF